MARLNRTNKAKQNKSLKGLDQPNILNGGKSDEILEGGISEDTINGGNGDDVLIGGEGADDFELSEGNDVVQDFNWWEGDQIVLPEGTDLSKLTIEKEGKSVVIKVGDEYKTIIEDANLRDVIKTISDKALENALDETPPAGTTSKQTIVNTGLITKGINNEIHLPTQSALQNVMVFDAEGNQITQGDRGFVVDGRKVTINKTVPGYYKIAAEFDWNNPDGSTRENYLTWMRDVIQFGDKDGEGGVDPIEATSAFRLYMGDKISAIGDLKIDGSTSTYQMFDAAARFDGNLSDLNLGGVTDMYAMFRHAARFNNGGSDGIKDWDTSNVTRMRDAFWNALSFDQPLSGWNVDSVHDEGENGGMYRMFKNTPKFDRNLSNFSSDKLSPNLQTSFNTNLIGNKAGQKIRYPEYNEQLPSFTGENTYSNDQYVLKTRNIRSDRWDYLWEDQNNKEQGFKIKLPISPINKEKELVVNVVDNNNKTMEVSIVDQNTILIPRSGASQYTIKVSNGIWDNSDGANDFSNAANKLKWLDDIVQFGTNGIRSGIAAFAGYGGDSISDLVNLNVSGITSTRRMFSQARKFNQDLGAYFVGTNVTDSFAMFDEANSFNNGGSESISDWNTSSITYMRSMFRRATAFDQVSIKDWNVSSVNDQGNVGGMQEMFLYTPLFNADLSGWNATNLSLNLNTNFNTDLRGVPQGNWPKFENNDLDFNTTEPYEKINLSTAQKNTGNSDLRAAAFGNDTFIAGGGNGTILTSTDGSIWSSGGKIDGVVQGIEYGRNGFLAVTGNKEGNGTGSLYFTSDDGKEWSQKEVEGGNGLNYLDATFGNNVFIVPSKEGKVVVDGYGKIEAIAVSEKELRAATYGNNEFIIAGKDGAVYSSSDGIGWNDNSSRKFNFKTLVEDLQGMGKLPESDLLDQILGDENSKLSEININFNAATFGDDTHIIAGTGGAIFFKNGDSNDWKFANSPFKINESITSLNYADGLFIAGGTNGKTALSVDGSFWFEEPIEGYPSIDKDEKGNYNLNALASGNGVVIGVSSNETIAKIQIGSQKGGRKIYKQKKNELNDIDKNLTYLLGTNDKADTIAGNDGSDYFIQGYGLADSLTGANGNDTLLGDQGKDILSGKAGNDEIFGGVGTDSIKGQAGDDTLNGGDGNDTLIGGDGSDLFSLAINGETDKISDFTKGDNKLIAPPISSDIKIKTEPPSDGNNKNKRNIIIELSDGTTTSTTILENIPKSEFEGELREYIFEKLGIPILEGNDGITGIQDIQNPNKTLGFDSTDKYEKGVLISPFTLANALGEDVKEETIASKPLDINAGAGSDAVRGGNKSDSISGNDGADTVYGGNGADTINGGDGDDTIDGGAGLDLLEGGPGNDQYVLSTSEGGMDTIKGYATGDKIVLPGVTRQIIVDGLVEVGDKIPTNKEGEEVSRDENALAAYKLTYEITGNSSKAKSNQSADGKTLVITTGSFLPTADVEISSVTADVTNPSISGTNGELRTGETIQISSNDGEWADVEQETKLTWSFIDTVARDDEDSVTYKVRVIDGQQNVGTKTDEMTVTIDIPGSGGENPGSGGENPGSGGDNNGGDNNGGGGDGSGEGEPPVVLPDVPKPPEKPTPEPSPDEEVEGGIDNAPGAPEPSPTPEPPSEPEDGTIDGQPIVPTPEPGPTPETEEDPQLRQTSVIKDPKNKDFDNAFIGRDKKKDELNGSNKADVLKGKGKSDILKGSKGNDYLYGNNGGDILKGGKGADVLQGGSGKDELSGNGGKDMIYGGNNDDEISGNGGKDIFVLSRGKDIITDFKVGTDAIGLVYALDLKLKQKGNNLLIKTSDNVVHTKLLNVTRDEFLGDFSENNNYLQLPFVEVNVL